MNRRLLSRSLAVAVALAALSTLLVAGGTPARGGQGAQALQASPSPVLPGGPARP